MHSFTGLQVDPRAQGEARVIRGWAQSMWPGTGTQQGPADFPQGARAGWDLRETLPRAQQGWGQGTSSLVQGTAGHPDPAVLIPCPTPQQLPIMARARTGHGPIQVM